MNKCLVTKYEAIVNDNSLLKIGELRIGFRAAPHDGYRVNFTEYPVVIETVDGSLSLTTDKTMLTGFTNKLTIPERHYPFFTNNLNTVISVPNKYSINGFYDNLKLNLEDLKYCVNLKDLENLTCTGTLETIKNSPIYRIYGVIFEQTPNLSVLNKFPALTDFRNNNVIGDLSSISGLTNLEYFGIINSNTVTGNLSSISGLTNLNYFGIPNSNTVTGDLSSISGLTNLNYFDITNCYAVTGDLSSISGLTNLELVYLTGTIISGDIIDLGGLIKLKDLGINNKGTIRGEVIDLVLSQRSHGRTSGTMTLHLKQTNSNITFNGQVMNLEYINISWTASTITNETTSETVNR